MPLGRPENCFAGGGGGMAWAPGEGGGFQKWASVPGPLFCVRTDVATNPNPAPAQTPLPARRPRRGRGGLGKWASVPSPPRKAIFFQPWREARFNGALGRAPDVARAAWRFGDLSQANNRAYYQISLRRGRFRRGESPGRCGKTHRNSGVRRRYPPFTAAAHHSCLPAFTAEGLMYGWCPALSLTQAQVRQTSLNGYPWTPQAPPVFTAVAGRPNQKVFARPPSSSQINSTPPLHGAVQEYKLCTVSANCGNGATNCARVDNVVQHCFWTMATCQRKMARVE